MSFLATSRALASVLAASAVLGWGWREWGRGSIIAAWEEQAGRDQQQLLKVDESPGRVTDLAIFAAMAERTFFPAGNAPAELARRRAILKDPMRSELWLGLARALLFQGRRDQARVALERSDVLDPNFPAQRAEAIEVWTLLGQPDKAATLAHRLAELGPTYKAQAARVLRQAGQTPAEAFRIVGGPETPTSDLPVLLEALRSRNATSMEALMAAVPETAIADSRFQLAVFPMVVDPLVPRMALKFWRALGATCVDYDCNLLVANANLLAPPFPEGALPLGWQHTPRFHHWIEQSWDRAGQAHGRLRLAFSESADPDRHTVRLPLYRAVIPPGSAVVMGLHLHSDPPERSELQVELHEKGAVTESDEYDWTSHDSQSLSAHLLPSEEWRVVELVLRRTRRGAPTEPPPRVDVQSLILTLDEEESQ